MVLDAVSNFVRGTADAEVGTDDTTVSVADASIFPDPETDGEFNVVIWDVNNFPRPDQDGDVEILRVTARDTTADELTVTRAQEMTSAAAHPEGSAIHLSPTAKMFSDIESTFGDFWDADTEELTADVNNTNTTTQSLEAGSLSTESLVIGGTLYEEDGNSPQTGQDTDDFVYTVNDDFDEVIVIPDTNDRGWNQIRINEKSDNNYRVIENDDSRTTGANEWNISHSLHQYRSISISLSKVNNRVRLSADYAKDGQGSVVAGNYQGDAITSLDSIQFIDGSGIDREIKFRVFGRSMDI